jgi:hypothetical protein
MNSTIVTSGTIVKCANSTPIPRTYNDHRFFCVGKVIADGNNYFYAILWQVSNHESELQ